MTNSTSLTRPNLDDWRDWSLDDRVAYLLGEAAIRARLRGERSVASRLSDDEFRDFCAPIAERNSFLYGGDSPRVAIVLPAFEEELELLPTLLSHALADVEPGLAELVVADNNSGDHTAAVIESCGARRVLCTTKGVGHARRAGCEAISASVEYVWLTDADTRVVPPLKSRDDLSRRSTILTRCTRYLDAHPNVLGVSSGGVAEGGHWLYRAARSLSVRVGRSRPYSCWAGYNQFVRRDALDAIGGIDPEIEFGDDHHRHYELARLGKRTGRHLESANSNPELVDPVYYSGRRYANLSLLARHAVDTLRQPKLPRDEYGYPIHRRGASWRQIRLG